MTSNEKGHTGWHRATPKTSKCTCSSIGLAARIKVAIVTLAVWGLIPITVADWIIHRGEPHDE